MFVKRQETRSGTHGDVHWAVMIVVWLLPLVVLMSGRSWAETLSTRRCRRMTRNRRHAFRPGSSWYGLSAERKVNRGRGPISPPPFWGVSPGEGELRSEIRPLAGVIGVLTSRSDSESFG